MNALVVGGTRGIGREIANSLKEQGYDVTISYNKNINIAKKLEVENGYKIVKIDLGNIEELTKVFSGFEKLDCVVCCGGVAQYKMAIDVDEDDYDKVMNVNLKGLFFANQLAIKNMLKHDTKGNIINISSYWGEVGASLESVYSASKAGVIALTKSLAKEYGRSGIRVNCICPGAVDTDMLKNFSDEELEMIANETTINRIGTAKEVANLCEFLASDKASYINGECYTIKG